MKSNIYFLKEMEDNNDYGEILLLEEKIDQKELQDSINEMWEKITEKEDFNFEEIYDMIEKKYKVKEFIFIGNLPIIKF